MSEGDRLLPSRIRAHLTTGGFGRRIYYYPETDSTNRVALELARAGEPDGTLVVAEYQSRGRGRLDHVWSSPAGKDLLFSLVLRPQSEASVALPITLVFSVAAADALSRLVGTEVGVKWPNDMIAGDGKIGGILAEGALDATRSAFAVLGTGINVNSEKDDFPPELRDRVVSCRSIAGRVWDRADVLAGILHYMEEEYRRFRERGFAAVKDLYEEKLVIKGRRVSFEHGGARVRATVDGVYEDGALKLVSPEFTEPLALYGGEVHLEP